MTPENLNLKFQHYCLHFCLKFCAAKIQHSFWATSPMSSFTGLGTPNNSTIIIPERHNRFLQSVIFEIHGFLFFGFFDRHIFDGLGSFSGVLSQPPQVFLK
jgi:hypothetical protein